MPILPRLLLLLHMQYETLSATLAATPAAAFPTLLLDRPNAAGQLGKLASLLCVDRKSNGGESWRGRLP
jgi:hypothetical protein